MTELDQYFKFKCFKGLRARGLDKSKKHIERLNYEITVIQNMSFCGYFLVVMDILNWARNNKIPAGPGRGSVAGSLVAYCLNITQLDPVKYNLLFERFLNPDRISQPDCDLDFCELKRDKVVEYVKEKYGNDHVAGIGTYGSMKAKAAIRDVARVLGYEYTVGDKLAKLTLPPIAGKPQPLKTSYEQVPELAAAREQSNTKEGKVLYWAEKFEGRIRSYGQHASGYIISGSPIYNRIPLYIGKDSQPTTQFEMENVEEVGLIKFDFLGLRALTTIQRCIDMVLERHNINIDIDNIPLDYEDVYTILQQGDVKGIFQLEGSQGIKDMVVMVKPKNLEDISLIAAVYRPGPLSSGLVDQIVKVRNGTAEPEYLVPELEPILKDTAGVLIYQEQAMQICRDLAGYTMAESDTMRKAIGKKKQELMDEQKVKFISGMTSNGFEITIAEKLFETIQGFAKYSFNYAHALSYAFIGYQTAYLKAYYPLEFICSCLVSDSDEVEKIIKYLDYCRNHGIKVLSPSVNHSEYEFCIEGDNTIRFGLGAIKNLGKPAEVIVDERKKNGPYKDIIDFANRTDLSKINRKKLESLVYAGAFDQLGATRASLIETIEDIYRYNEEKERYDSKLETYNKRIVDYWQRQEEIIQWDLLNKEAKKQARLDGKKKPGNVKIPQKPDKPNLPTLSDIPEISESDKFVYEKEMMGFYISGHPLDIIEEKSNYSIEYIKENAENKQKFKLIAIPSIIKDITTNKTKKRMAYVTLEDKTGMIDAILLPNLYDKFKHLLDIKLPARYSIESDVIEGDTSKIVKARIKEITMLPSIRKKLEATLPIKVSINNAIDIARLINNSSGKDFKIKLQLESNGGNLLDIGIFQCTGSKDSFTKKIKELI